MKKNLLLGFLVKVALCHAQVGIGNNVTTFDNSEVLKSITTKYFYSQSEQRSSGLFSGLVSAGLQHEYHDR